MEWQKFCIQYCPVISVYMDFISYFDVILEVSDCFSLPINGATIKDTEDKKYRSLAQNIACMVFVAECVYEVIALIFMFDIRFSCHSLDDLLVIFLVFKFTLGHMRGYWG